MFLSFDTQASTEERIGLRERRERERQIHSQKTKGIRNNKQTLNKKCNKTTKETKRNRKSCWIWHHNSSNWLLSSVGQHRTKNTLSYSSLKLTITAMIHQKNRVKRAPIHQDLRRIARNHSIKGMRVCRICSQRKWRCSCIKLRDRICRICLNEANIAQRKCQLGTMKDHIARFRRWIAKRIKGSSKGLV